MMIFYVGTLPNAPISEPQPLPSADHPPDGLLIGVRPVPADLRGDALAKVLEGETTIEEYHATVAEELAI